MVKFVAVTRDLTAIRDKFLLSDYKRDVVYLYPVWDFRCSYVSLHALECVRPYVGASVRPLVVQWHVCQNHRNWRFYASKVHLASDYRFSHLLAVYPVLFFEASAMTITYAYKYSFLGFHLSTGCTKSKTVIRSVRSF